MRALACALALVAASAQAATVPEYDALLAARPDGRRVTVKGLVLHRDAFTIELRSGVVHFLTPVGNDTIGAVFIGDGSYVLTPATISERQHLRLVTNDAKLETLTDRFDRVLLFFTDKTAQEVLAHAPLETGAPNKDAVDYYEDSVLDRLTHGPKPLLKEAPFNIYQRLLIDLVNRPRREDGLFLAPVDGRTYGKAAIVVDPLGIASLSTQFNDYSGEEVALLSASAKNGGLWYLSTFATEAKDGRGKPLRALADATNYQIETLLDGNQIAGRGTITFTPLVPGVRVLPVQIAPVLEIREASVDAGAGTVSLPILREHLIKDDVAVVFPAALAPGQPVRLRLDYAGKDVLVGFQDRYAVGARTSWYPNLGTFTDLATYELTFRYPRRHVLVSVGRLESERVEGDQKVAVWKSDVPMRVAGFNYGQFQKLDAKDDQTGLSVSAYTNPESAAFAKGALADAINATRVADRYFGKPVYPHIAMTQQVQANFGQSWPTLVYMPGFFFTNTQDLLEFLPPNATASLAEFINTVGWHEVSHQWWGHEVGWESYRDQWLSEGFAEFTAALMLEFTENRVKYDRYWDVQRKQIVEKGRFMAPYEAGPITMGYRLATERSGNAPQSIIYGKGGYVLHMLRMMMRDERAGADADRAFREMMQDFVKTFAGKNPSTADFQRVAERHMLPVMDLDGNKTLDYFFNQWVRGTDVPLLKSTLKVDELGGGRYRISGAVSQSDVPADFHTLVPLYLDYGDGAIQKLGVVPLTGPKSQNVTVELPLSRKPRRALINARSDVLSR